MKMVGRVGWHGEDCWLGWLELIGRIGMVNVVLLAVPVENASTLENCLAFREILPPLTIQGLI